MFRPFYEAVVVWFDGHRKEKPKTDLPMLSASKMRALQPHFPKTGAGLACLPGSFPPWRAGRCAERVDDRQHASQGAPDRGKPPWKGGGGLRVRSGRPVAAWTPNGTLFATGAVARFPCAWLKGRWATTRAPPYGYPGCRRRDIWSAIAATTAIAFGRPWLNAGSNPASPQRKIARCRSRTTRRATAGVTRPKTCSVAWNTGTASPGATTAAPILSSCQFASPTQSHNKHHNEPWT